jgi:carboxyl-terminal processing protease
MIKQFIIAIILLFPLGAIAQSTKIENAFEVSKNLDIYYALFKEMSEYYVDPIEPGKLVKRSIDVMLDNLDPYTNYISEDDIEDYRFQNTGKYGGIGCSFRTIDGMLVIDEPLNNSPVVKSGLKAGDIIIEIDGRSTKNVDEESLRKLVKGSAGTSVKFKVQNPITKQTTEKVITREEIQISNITLSTLVGPKKDLALVRLSQFTENASTNIRTALDSLKRTNRGSLSGVIIDLRGNPGGLLDEAVNICNLFLNRDVLVVSTKGKVDEWVKEYKTNNLAWDDKVPVIILVNKGSASASEIVSGTLQDLDRGVVIGQRSFGKGLVQATRNLPYNSKLKVTTARYYTPSGRCIQALDYSKRNEDGSVGEVADSLKKLFFTKNGRKVYDGGGVDPDVKVTMAENSKLLSVLLNKHYIFNYVTELVANKPSIDSADKYGLQDADVEAFFKWLENKDYAYKTKTEESLDKWKEQAEKEKYFDAVKAEYDNLLKALNKDKKQDLIKNKAAIKKALQSEIVTRYYYEKGRYINELIEDKDLKEAVDLLSNVDKYNGVLQGK